MRYQMNTVWAPEVIIEQAKRHFGPQGTGLQITSQNGLGVIFQGGGGYVAVAIQPQPTHAVVELETREWDYAVTQFMRRAPNRLPWWKRWRRQRPMAPAPSQNPFPIRDQDL